MKSNDQHIAYPFVFQFAKHETKSRRRICLGINGKKLKKKKKKKKLYHMLTELYVTQQMGCFHVLQEGVKATQTQLMQCQFALSCYIQSLQRSLVLCLGRRWHPAE